MATLTYMPGTLTGLSPCLRARSALIHVGVGRGCSFFNSMQSVLSKFLNSLSTGAYWELCRYSRCKAKRMLDKL